VDACRNRSENVDPERLIFLIWSATQHYADFQVQALSLLNRAEFDDPVLTETADFLVAFILRGCGLAPERQTIMKLWIKEPLAIFAPKLDASAGLLVEDGLITAVLDSPPRAL
jgi:hypothetical protein